MCPKPHWSLSLICIFHGYTRPMVPGYSFSFNTLYFLFQSLVKVKSSFAFILNPRMNMYTYRNLLAVPQYLKFSSIPTSVSFSCLFIFSDIRPLINKLFAQWLPDQQKNHRDPNPVYRSIIKDQWCFYQNRKP